MRKLTDYTHTLRASYLGYITQAIVNNLAPLLFLTFAREFSLSLPHITLITTLNFAVQLLVDLLSAPLIDRIGYRVSIVAAHVFAAAGLCAMALLPGLLSSAYAGLLIAVVLYAVGGGIIEVLISPIVEACPTEKKAAAMSLLHSFYCWGHVGVVLLATAFFAVFGTARWRVLALLLALVPAANAVYFSRVPIYPIVPEGGPTPLGHLLRSRVFWLLMLLMVCAGASEQAMSQWASTFAESALGIAKAAGDLAGPCAFAVLMGTARALYGKFGDRIPLRRAMSASAALCVVCYLTAVFSQSALFALLGCALCGFSVGIFWPGTFSMAAASLPGAGTAMYALMALAGDVGCSGGPTVVGLVAGACGDSLRAGLLAGVAFPAVILLGIALLPRRRA